MHASSIHLLLLKNRNKTRVIEDKEEEDEDVDEFQDEDINLSDEEDHEEHDDREEPERVRASRARDDCVKTMANMRTNMRIQEDSLEEQIWELLIKYYLDNTCLYFYVE